MLVLLTAGVTAHDYVYDGVTLLCRSPTTTTRLRRALQLAVDYFLTPLGKVAIHGSSRWGPSAVCNNSEAPGSAWS